MRSFSRSLSPSVKKGEGAHVKNNYNNLVRKTGRAWKVRGNTPGIALIESKVSAMCCSLVEEDGESMEGGKVTMATAFETISILFSNLMKESMSDSCVLTEIINQKEKKTARCLEQHDPGTRYIVEYKKKYARSYRELFDLILPCQNTHTGESRMTGLRCGQQMLCYCCFCGNHHTGS